MSYDVSLLIHTGKDVREVVDCGNMTWNVGPMFVKALGNGLTEILDGKQAGEVIDILHQGIEDMKAKPEEYRELNPENSWGDYEGALRYLENIYQECSENPLCIISVN